uniref:Uncharacterized protein n=1 Tax=Cucumis melo TaxID=3656 RepID=A0A9I9DQJ8_CUCME
MNRGRDKGREKKRKKESEELTGGVEGTGGDGGTMRVEEWATSMTRPDVEALADVEDDGSRFSNVEDDDSNLKSMENLEKL